MTPSSARATAIRVLFTFAILAVAIWGIPANPAGLSNRWQANQRPRIPSRPVSTRKLGSGHGDLYPEGYPPRVFGPDYLIWQEEFDDLNLQVWDHMVTAWRGGNKEFQFYRNDRRNSYVRDGVLYLRPTLTAEEFGEDVLYNGSISFPGCNHKPCESAAGQDIVLPFLSSRIRTHRSFGFRYGRVEVRAKLPRGDWLWPAIWMKPVENFYGGWPSSGEIDLVEARGNKRLFTYKGTNMGVERMSSTLHYGPNASYNIWRPTHWELSLEGSGSDFASDYHLYGMEWSRNAITFTVDNEVTGYISPPSGGFWKIGGFDQNPGGRNIWENGEYLAPFDREFFFVLNVAVGGTFFPAGWKNEPYPRPWNWSSLHPIRDMWENRDWWLPTWLGEDSALKVDYIRVFSLPSPF